MRGIAAPLVKLVVFAVVTITATAVLAATIANIDFTAKTGYRARFTDVTGLLPGDDVRIAGVRVGKVDHVAVADRRLADVRFSVRSDVRLPASTRLAVRYRNLVGQRYLAVEAGPGDPGATLRAGATVPVEHTSPPLDLTALFNGFKPLFAALSPGEVNQLSWEIIQVLQGEGGTIESLLAHTASLTNTIADRDATIGQLIDNLNVVLDTVNTRDSQLSELIVQLQQLVSGLAADRNSIGSAISSIAELTDATAGLLADARPPVRDDILKIGALAKNLNDSEALVRDWLKTTPVRLETIGRTASYGSWFNFYLCAFTAHGNAALVLPGDIPVDVPPYRTNEARCR